MLRGSGVMKTHDFRRFGFLAYVQTEYVWLFGLARHRQTLTKQSTFGALVYSNILYGNNVLSMFQDGTWPLNFDKTFTFGASEAGCVCGNVVTFEFQGRW